MLISPDIQAGCAPVKGTLLLMEGHLLCVVIAADNADFFSLALRPLIYRGNFHVPGYTIRHERWWEEGKGKGVFLTAPPSEG